MDAHASLPSPTRRAFRLLCPSTSFPGPAWTASTPALPALAVIASTKTANRPIQLLESILNRSKQRTARISNRPISRNSPRFLRRSSPSVVDPAALAYTTSAPSLPAVAGSLQRRILPHRNGCSPTTRLPRFDRYTCRSKNAVKPMLSTTMPNLIDTLFTTRGWSFHVPVRQDRVVILRASQDRVDPKFARLFVSLNPSSARVVSGYPSCNAARAVSRAPMRLAAEYEVSP